jgi:hypothetical protein
MYQSQSPRSRRRYPCAYCVYWSYDPLQRAFHTQTHLPHVHQCPLCIKRFTNRAASDAISTKSTSSDTRPHAASTPSPCHQPRPTRVTSVPILPSVKPFSTSTSPYICLSNNDPISVQRVNENSPTNTICATMSASTTQTGSRNSSANTATSDQIGNRIWSATLSSCMPAQVWMHKSPATCQNQSPGGLLSLFLRYARLPHTLRTRTFNLAVG